jgi:uncharacterized protein YegP (UPF0339 family)
MKTSYRIEIVRSKNKGWFWRLKHRNGKTLAHSEIYTTKAKARQTVRNFVKNLGIKIRVEKGKI